MLSEIKIHQDLDHKNIVKFKHFFEDSNNVYVLLELCSNQTLNDLVKKRGRLQEIEAKCFTLQIIDAVDYLHKNKRVIHRDLKLGNLFLHSSNDNESQMEIKLGDFGLACQLKSDDDRKITLWGTPNYIAPEVLLNSKKGYSYEIDVWAIGVIIYAMIVGRPPFETKDVKTTYWKIQNTSYEYPDDIDLSVEAKHLIDSILTFNPSDRLTLEDIRNHPWISKCAFIPKTLPVECYRKIIPADQLLQLEKTPSKSTHQQINEMYFEDRDSKDGKSHEDSKEKLNYDDLNSVIDLDNIDKLPNTERIWVKKQKDLMKEFTDQSKVNQEVVTTRNQSPVRHRLMTFHRKSQKVYFLTYS